MDEAIAVATKKRLSPGRLAKAVTVPARAARRSEKVSQQPGDAAMLAEFMEVAGAHRPPSLGEGRLAEWQQYLLDLATTRVKAAERATVAGCLPTPTWKGRRPG